MKITTKNLAGNGSNSWFGNFSKSVSWRGISVVVLSGDWQAARNWFNLSDRHWSVSWGSNHWFTIHKSCYQFPSRYDSVAWSTEI